MKYMVLIYDNANSRDAFFGEGTDALMREIDTLMTELTESGELIGGDGAGRAVEHADRAPRDGVPAVTDGPFVEAKEHFGGYLLRRVREPRARDRDRRALARRPLRGDGGAAAMDTSGTEMSERPVEDLLRELAPQVLGVLVRRYGRLRRLRGRRPGGADRGGRRSGPPTGVPENPRGWLITVASRRLTDELRSEQARRRREDADAARRPGACRPAAGDRRPTSGTTR